MIDKIPFSHIRRLWIFNPFSQISSVYMYLVVTWDGSESVRHSKVWTSPSDLEYHAQSPVPLLQVWMGVGVRGRGHLSLTLDTVFPGKQPVGFAIPVTAASTKLTRHWDAFILSTCLASESLLFERGASSFLLNLHLLDPFCSSEQFTFIWQNLLSTTYVLVIIQVGIKIFLDLILSSNSWMFLPRHVTGLLVLS